MQNRNNNALIEAQQQLVYKELYNVGRDFARDILNEKGEAVFIEYATKLCDVCSRTDNAPVIQGVQDYYAAWKVINQ